MHHLQHRRQEKPCQECKQMQLVIAARTVKPRCTWMIEPSHALGTYAVIICSLQGHLSPLLCKDRGVENKVAWLPRSHAPALPRDSPHIVFHNQPNQPKKVLMAAPRRRVWTLRCGEPDGTPSVRSELGRCVERKRGCA
jgi:hypothetical protein